MQTPTPTLPPEPESFEDSSAEIAVYEPSEFLLLNPVSGSSDLRDTAWTERVYNEIAYGETFFQLQGACSDGIHIWAGWSSPYAITRYTILTGAIEFFYYADRDWPFGHINDMTYNPDTGKLYIVSYDPDAYSTSGSICVVDPETLHVDDIIQLKRNGKMCPVHGIAYDRLNRRYVTATRDSRGRGYDIFDEEFRYLETVMTERHEDYIVQGIETDGQYIYRSLSEPGGQNHLVVYDFDGHFLKMITIPVDSSKLELEDILYDWQGNWFLAYADHEHQNGGFALDYVGLLDRVDYTQVSRFFGMVKRWLLKVG